MSDNINDVNVETETPDTEPSVETEEAIETETDVQTDFHEETAETAAVPEPEAENEQNLVEETQEPNASEEARVEENDSAEESEQPVLTEMSEKPEEADNSSEESEDDDEEVGKKGKKKKKRPTYAQRRKRRITALISVCSVILVLGIFISGIAIANPLIVKALIAQANNYATVAYDHEQLEPEKIDGCWTFTTDKQFKVQQFTDVHIGAGSFSKDKDMWAMNAVATMIRKEQPDLVVVTGDIAYPVPFQAGTFNNLAATQVFANMMEKLGVYWTFAFGNHDTEAYSMKTRADICDWYESQNFKYCLFSRGYADDPSLKLKEDDIGYGNNVIRVKNSKGVYTQAIVTLDSHSYIDGDYFGAAWKYDNIHQSQVDWYVGEMQKLVTANNALLANDPSIGIEQDAPVKNLAFFHIPLVEYREAWGKIIDLNGGTKATEEEQKNGRYNNLQNPEGVEYFYGVMGESDKQKNRQRTYGVFCGLNQDSFFETGVDNGLQGTFCGHDHYNNFSVNYTKDGKTVRLTYGMSVDYLAYPGIYKEHLQRGCTVIEVEPDGSFDCEQKNYYNDYDIAHEKD